MPDVPDQNPTDTDTPEPRAAPPASESTTVAEVERIHSSADREDLSEFLEVEDPATVAAVLSEAEPHAAARLLSDLSPDRASRVTDLLEPDHAAAIVTRMDPQRAAEMIEQLDPGVAADVLQEMNPDDRVDVLGEVDEELHDTIVAQLDAEERAEVAQLERYPPDTAGGIMTTEVTSLYEYLSVQDAIETLRRLSEELEQMYYVYVIDDRGHLVGVLSMRDMILARPDMVLHEIMIPEVRSVPATMDQEAVAELFRRYNYLAVPVVDERNRLIGLITIDDIVDVLHEETTEDVHRLFGAGAEEKLTSPWFFTFRKRIGWLNVNLITATLSASVVAAFSGMIEAIPILAVFMPIIAGMGGNASAQAMAVAVRGISVGRVDRRTLHHVITREFLSGGLSGLTMGILTGLVAAAYGATRDDREMSQAMALGAVVFLALLINLTVACVVGAGFPFLMKRLGFDPAQSATIFSTTITDVVGFLALLGLAAIAARGLGIL